MMIRLSTPRVRLGQDGEMTGRGVFSEREARTLAQGLLDQGSPWAILEVREFPVGWIVIWDLQRNLEATNIGDKVPGCAPILVDRSDGSVHFTGTAKDIEEYIERYLNRDPENESSWHP